VDRRSGYSLCTTEKVLSTPPVLVASKEKEPLLLYIAATNPGIEHWKMVKKVLRYVQGTKDLMLTYRRSDSLEIKGYSDADYARDKDDRKSTIGYVFTLTGGSISWRSCKQSIVASSTMYAKFIACFEATNQVIWLKKFIPNLKVVDCIEKPLKMYYDNQPAVFYAHNNKSSKAT
jgi:hypothetical protein